MDVYSAPQIAELQPIIQAHIARAARWRKVGRALLYLAAIAALVATGIV